MEDNFANRNGKIALLAVEDRPREKMVRLGAGALSDAELLAILVGSGSAEESAIELMQHILRDYNNDLSALGKCTVDELTAYKGVGMAKAVTILAACELGKRRGMTEDKREVVRSSADVYALMKHRMKDMVIEECWVILLNQSFKVVGIENISKGGITAAMVDVRMVIKAAVLKQATALALCHNHPSGSTRPSREDDDLTRRVYEACRVMQIKMIDHVIVSENGYYSYADADKLG